MTSARKESAVTLKSGEITLEGRLCPGPSDRAAVITHPHPLYGGDMDSPVVQAIAGAYHQCGWGTLRFNFRGAGASQGRFDHGQGEQTDVSAAVAYLKQEGCRTVELAGYSFGAWVLAKWASRYPQHAARLRLVAPPVAFMGFDMPLPIHGLAQIAVGTQDEFAPLGQVRREAEDWAQDVPCDIIRGADHFFWNHLDALSEVLIRGICPG